MCPRQDTADQGVASFVIFFIFVNKILTDRSLVLFSAALQREGSLPVRFYAGGDV